MKLNVKDRIILLRILPVEGDFRTMKTIMDIRNKLLFSDTEVKDFGLVQENNIYRWDSASETGIDVEISELANDVIVGSLRELDASGKLTAETVPLWEQFVETEGCEPDPSLKLV
jgi:hypothetical protein